MPRCPAETEIKSKSSIVSSAKTGKSFFAPKTVTPAADIAGERLDVLERDHLRFACSGGAGQLFEVQLRVAGNDRESVLLRAGGA